MWNMGVKIDFRDEILEWDGHKNPTKDRRSSTDKRAYSMLYTMHLDSPISKRYGGTSQQEDLGF